MGKGRGGPYDEARLSFFIQFLSCVSILKQCGKGRSTDLGLELLLGASLRRRLGDGRRGDQWSREDCICVRALSSPSLTPSCSPSLPLSPLPFSLSQLLFLTPKQFPLPSPKSSKGSFFCFHNSFLSPHSPAGLLCLLHL